jgi:class 3 adenylate cyclase
MSVLILQVDATINDIYEEKIDKTDEQGEDEGEDDVVDIGEQVEAHIPDIVLTNLNDIIDRKGNISIPSEHSYNNATLLFFDVSGFTSLTELYSNDANLGVDQLSRELNSYFSKLVYEILTHDGDIYKFGGDAILALWTNEETGPQQALKCAINCQQKCGAYQTNVGIILRVKAALAYGHIRILFVGKEEFRHYFLTGDCVKNVNACENLCKPGDIIITKAIYEKIESTTFNCQFVPLSDDIIPKHEYIAVKYSLSRRSSMTDESDTEDHINNVKLINDRMVCRYLSDNNSHMLQTYRLNKHLITKRRKILELITYKS